MKSKKSLLIIFSNVLIFLILFVCLDKYFENNYMKFTGLFNMPVKNDDNINVNNIETENLPEDLELPFTDESFNEWCGEERRKFGETFTKKPIIVLGCSYAYGHGLAKEESFPNILLLTLQKPVISFTNCASNISVNIIFVNNYIK